MSYRLTVEYQPHGASTFHTLESYGLDMPEAARRRARNYALDHGGRTRIVDGNGKVLASFPEETA